MEKTEDVNKRSIKISDGYDAYFDKMDKKDRRPSPLDLYTAGYSLASEELAEKDKHIKYAERIAYETSAKNADMIAELKALREENERLKRQIKSYETDRYDKDENYFGHPF